jgi:hypothetical protein
MAWTNISNALVSVGALPFATTIQALRDNPIAIANGDVGAPQIQTAALIAGERMTTNNVQNAYAGVAASSVGTFAFALDTTTTTRNPGSNSTVGGASLQLSNANGGSSGVLPLTGTWRICGFIPSGGTAVERTTLWLRIA